MEAIKKDLKRTDQVTLYGLGRRQKQKYSLEQNAQTMQNYSKYRLNLPKEVILRNSDR